jgi:hypothetical protein
MQVVHKNLHFLGLLILLVTVLKHLLLEQAYMLLFHNKVVLFINSYIKNVYTEYDIFFDLRIGI